MQQNEVPRLARLAYLVSNYPTPVFILREVCRLRDSSFEIHVASINSPDRARSKMADEELKEADSTFYIKQKGLRGAAWAHFNVLVKSPRSYLRGLWFAVRLAGSDLKQQIFAFFYFTEALILGRWMASQKLRHLHVHFANAAATVGLIVSHTFPIDLSLSVHGPDEFDDVPGFKLREKISGSSFIRCIGDFSRSQLMKLSDPEEWKKFEIARLGVDPRLFVPRPFRRAPETFEILCVGRLVPAKGQHLLLEAIGRLVKSVPNIRVRLLGDGPDRASLERAIAAAGLGQVVFTLGNVSQDRIREYYSAADVFVLASFAEGIPVALMEAMAMEIPCVSTFVAGIPELIRNDVDGLLVVPSDDQALASALKRLLEDPQLRYRLGVAGRQRVIDKFNLDSNVKTLARVFYDRIGRSPSSPTLVRTHVSG